MSRRFAQVALGFLMVLLGTVARAADADFDAYFRAAVLSFEALEYERALGHVVKAKTVAKAPSDEARASLLEGVLLSELGRDEEAHVAFKSALYLDPAAPLPVRVSPKVEAGFASVRAEVQREVARSGLDGKSAAPPQAVKTPEDSVTSSSSSSVRSFAWIPLAGGVLALGGSTLFALQAKSAHDELNTAPRLTREEMNTLVQRGKERQTISFALGALGVGALVGSAAMFALGGSSASVAVIPGGASVMFSGALP